MSIMAKAAVAAAKAAWIKEFHVKFKKHDYFLLSIPSQEHSKSNLGPRVEQKIHKLKFQCHQALVKQHASYATNIEMEIESRLVDDPSFKSEQFPLQQLVEHFRYYLQKTRNVDQSLVQRLAMDQEDIQAMFQKWTQSRENLIERMQNIGKAFAKWYA